VVIQSYASIPLFSAVWFWRERHEASFFVAIRWHLVYGEVSGGEYHEGQIGGFEMEVQISALLRVLLDVLGFAAAV
jgi:hypothetical protein